MKKTKIVKVTSWRHGKIYALGTVENFLVRCKELSMPSKPEYTLSSPAKVNLGLSIVGKREDGYHLLESLFWPLDFADQLEIHPSSKNEVSCEWDRSAPFSDGKLPSQEENLVYRLLETSGIGPVRVDITKKIPMGAGLGGGSSNAGTLLRHWQQIQPDTKDIEKVAATLGADVSFFLESKAAWVSGVGEKREVLELETGTEESLYFLLILLPLHCNTKQIFEQYHVTGTSFSKAQGNPFAGGKVTKAALVKFLTHTQNDLEPTAIRLYPLIGEALAELRQTKPIYAGLSGSGSTCFAVFSSQQDLEKSAKVLLPFCRNRSCKSIAARTFSNAD